MKKRVWDRKALSRHAVLAAILLGIVFVVHEIFGEHGYLALRRQKKEYEALQEQIHQLQRENERLEQQIKALKSDPKAVEKLAREQMRMARPGEIIFTLPERTKAPTSPSSK